MDFWKDNSKYKWISIVLTLIGKDLYLKVQLGKMYRLILYHGNVSYKTRDWRRNQKYVIIHQFGVLLLINSSRLL